MVKARRSETYTGEPYENMEVVIIRGSFKGYQGRVLVSSEREDGLRVTVQPWSMGGNHQTLQLPATSVLAL
jgi:ribosomal protein L24